MNLSEKKNKRNGILGTILFHSLLLCAFLFLGLSYTIPPPPEEGISINFGFNDEGYKIQLPEDNSIESDPITEKIIQESTEIKKEIVAQDIAETITIEDPDIDKEDNIKEQPEEKTEEIIIKETEPIINQKALYTGIKKNKEQSDGTGKKNKNEGLIEGEINSKNYNEGGVGFNGEAYQLSGRSVAYKAKPIYNIQLEGKVVVNITVDQLGNVINAIAGVKGSTTLNSQLLKRAKEAALKTKFTAKESAPSRQQGKIIYNFQLN